jgi:RNA polymerase sigma factor (sigma-70 family)
MDNRPLRYLLDRLRRAAATPGDGLSDAELLRRFVRRRDEAAFELLVWRHGPMVLGVCRRVLRDTHAAEDAFQATFLVLVRKAGGIARGVAVGPWLYRVAFRVALRARAAVAKRPAQALPGELPAPATAGLTECDWQPILDEEIDRLPERYRRPVVLCHLQGHTLAEAARQLGCPRGTVAVRLARARQKLRARLTRRGVALTAALPAALASSSAVSAALVKAAVRGALGYALGTTAGALSTSVFTLTEGVVRAMLLSKLKLVAVVLMATALAGAGVGWATYRADAGEPPTGGDARAAPRAGDEPVAPRRAPDRRSEDEQAAAARRRQERQKRLDQAADLLAATEAKLAKREAQWLEELIDARLKLLDLQEELKARERDLDEEAKAPDPRADVRLHALIAERDQATRQLAAAKAAAANENEPRLTRMREALKEIEAQIEATQRELERQATEKKKRWEVCLAGVRKLRRDVMVAEEKVRALRRRQEWEREEARRDLEEWARRVRQLRQDPDEAESPGPGAGRAAADLERKFDEVLRELGELRRSLRPPSERKPEEP